MQDVIDRYFRAWESQNPELLTEVFAHDARYLAQPFGIEEYEGLEAIEHYWRAKPVGIQVNPKPMIISQVFGEDSCFIEWETTFATHSGTAKVVRGMMRLEFENGLVKELREHYASKETA
jgi:hypothetical protein